MSQNPTIPPVPKRPPPKPLKIPAITEVKGARAYHIDPFRDINGNRPVDPPKRHHTPSEVDIVTARHDEQIKGLDRRLGGVEEILPVLDQKLDHISASLAKEINERALEKVGKEEEKHAAERRSKLIQAILVAIPLILSPILGFYGSYMSKPTPDYKPYTVIVSKYTKDVEDCYKEAKSREDYVTCVRQKQLENTPVFEK